MNDINKYIKLIEVSKTSFYPSCTSFTHIFPTMILYNLKLKSGWFDTSFTQLLKLMREITPKENKHLDSPYATKRLIK